MGWQFGCGDGGLVALNIACTPFECTPFFYKHDGYVWNVSFEYVCFECTGYPQKSTLQIH